MDGTQKRCHFVGLNRNYCKNGNSCPCIHDMLHQRSFDKKERRMRKRHYKEEEEKYLPIPSTILR